MGTADVFIDPVNNGAPDGDPTASGGPSSWAACARAALGYYALDVTQPDDIDAHGRLGRSRQQGHVPGLPERRRRRAARPARRANRKYPEILWEFTTRPTCSTVHGTSPRDGRDLVAPGRRPHPGPRQRDGARRRTATSRSSAAASTRASARATAVMRPGVPPTRPPQGHGRPRVLHRGRRDGQDPLQDDPGQRQRRRRPWTSPPMPAPPAVVDFDDDGYLDVAYIGDVNGNMWRIDLTPDSPPTAASATAARRPRRRARLPAVPALRLRRRRTARRLPAAERADLLRAGVVFVGGGVRRPSASPSARATAPSSRGRTPRCSASTTSSTTTRARRTTRRDLLDITPTGGVHDAGTPVPDVQQRLRPRLRARATRRRLTRSSRRRAILTLVTFTPDSISPCATNGSRSATGSSS